MLKKLFFTIISFCVLFVSTGSSSAVENVTDDVQNAGIKTENDYSDCQCKNGYCGFDDQFQYVCKCPEEYGPINSNECKRCDCGLGSNCTFKRNSFRDDKTCLCKKGYKDVGGLCTVVCDSEYCNYRGTCSIELDGPKCTCRSLYSGDRCEKVSCTSNNCNYRGKCTLENYEPVCSCEEPYFGDKCEKGPCEPNPCYNGGSCIVEEEKATCHCRSGYSGDYCLEKDTCEPNPCQNGGTCSSLFEGNYVCFCTARYMGTRCQLDLDNLDSIYAPDYTILQIIGGVGLFLILVSCFIYYRYRRNRRMNNTTVTTLQQPTVVAPPIHQNQYVPQYQPVQQFPPPPPAYFEQFHGTTSNTINAPIAPPIYQRY